jgi:hypothetical protein
MKVQISCPYFKGLIINGVQYTACMGLKQMLTAENIQHLCCGDKCPLPIISKQEIKQ